MPHRCEEEEKHRLLGASPPPARGLRPPRMAKAILPPGIPHDEPASPARFLSVCGICRTVAPLLPPQRPAAPLQLAFQKSQADRAVIHSRGQGRRKCRPWHDFRAAQPHFGRLEGSGKVKRPMPLYGLPTRPAFSDRSSGYHTPRRANGESIPQNSPFCAPAADFLRFQAIWHAPRYGGTLS